MARHRHTLRQTGHHIPRSSPTARRHRLGQAFIRHALTTIDAERESLGEDIALCTQRVTDALNLLEGAHTRYLAATPVDRKQLNNALVSRVLIGPSDENLHVELHPEIAELTSYDNTSEVFA